MHICEYYFSHVIHYWHVSAAAVVIIRAIYKIAGSPNRLLKCICEPLTVRKNVSDFSHSHWTSAH